jgi:hypothetical protein
MNTWIESVSYQEALPKTLKYCKTCQMETPHQIRCGERSVANTCIFCMERALAYELDRD